MKPWTLFLLVYIVCLGLCTVLLLEKPEVATAADYCTYTRCGPGYREDCFIAEYCCKASYFDCPEPEYPLLKSFLAMDATCTYPCWTSQSCVDHCVPL